MVCKNLTVLLLGKINLEKSQMEVDEDIGNFNLCLTTDGMLCLSVTSQDGDAGVSHT